MKRLSQYKFTRVDTRVGEASFSPKICHSVASHGMIEIALTNKSVFLLLPIPSLLLLLVSMSLPENHRYTAAKDNTYEVAKFEHPQAVNQVTKRGCLWISATQSE